MKWENPWKLLGNNHWKRTCLVHEEVKITIGQKHQGSRMEVLYCQPSKLISLSLHVFSTFPRFLKFLTIETHVLLFLYCLSWEFCFLMVLLSWLIQSWWIKQYKKLIEANFHDIAEHMPLTLRWVLRSVTIVLTIKCFLAFFQLLWIFYLI